MTTFTRIIILTMVHETFSFHHKTDSKGNENNIFFLILILQKEENDKNFLFIAHI